MAAVLGLSFFVAVAVAAPREALADAGKGRAPRSEAATLFDEASRAFDAGDFLRAAEAFDAAYRLAPAADTLWNEARSWDRGGDLARAAATLSRYLREAPPRAADRGVAQARLTQLTPRLGRIELHAEAGAEVSVDGASAEPGVVYVNAGSHVVVATLRGARQQRTVEVARGDTVAVAFEAPLPPPAPPLAAPDERVTSALPSPLAPVPAVSSAPERRGVSPWFVAGGAALAAAGAGVTVWSGLDTLSALHMFNAHPTSSNLSDGKSAETRTNVLLGATLGVAALTGAFAVWVVDWRAGASARVRVSTGLSFVGAESTF